MSMFTAGQRRGWRTVIDARQGPLSGRFDCRTGTADEKVVWEVWDDNTYGWEPGQLAGRQVLDLGANIGAFTVWACKAGAGHVRAVEAESGNFGRLVEHVTINRCGTAEAVYAAAGPAGTYRVTNDGTGASSWTEAGGEVVGRDMAALLDGLGDSVVVKCDIEGAEYPLFRDAADVDLRRIDMLAMEWHTPGIPGGLGARPYPETDPWPVGEIARRMSLDHRVHLSGAPAAGGMLWAYRN